MGLSPTTSTKLGEYTHGCEYHLARMITAIKSDWFESNIPHHFLISRIRLMVGRPPVQRIAGVQFPHAAPLNNIGILTGQAMPVTSGKR